MDFPLNVIIRLRLVNKPGTLASVLDVIAREEGDLGGIDLVASTPAYVDREVGVRLSNKDDLHTLKESLSALPGVEVVHVADRVMLRHRRGKIEIKARREVENREDLSLIYTPGVARVSEAIHQSPDLAYKFTMKGNAVAIVTDGTAVLGLGNIGPLAALPVMEGKSVLFKKFAGIDAVPLCINTQDTQSIIDTVVACAPAFGGINLEDIAAPGCFEVEEKLRDLLDIPVFHDDQHGTAIVTMAGLLNALKVVNKSMEQVRVVVSGAGAAGVAIVKMLLSLGVGDVVVCDSRGAISKANPPKEPAKRWLMENTNKRSLHGSLKEVVVGADVFVGVSVPNLLDRENVLSMAENPVIFALANPEPEVTPREVCGIAGVVATGRSDFPNQINNALVFPGVFRGALDSHARAINEPMCLAAVHALAGMIGSEELSREYIIPSIFNKDVCSVIANAVKEAAVSSGLSREF